MMKIAGTVMIAISTLLFGYLRYEKYKSRPKDIELFITILSAYRLELKWSKKSFDEIVKDFHCKGYDPYLRETSILLGSGSRVNAYIDENKYFSSMNLSSDDTDIIRYFLSESGKGSLMSEMSLCEKALNTLEVKKQEAEAEFRKQGPLVLKLGAVCGAWIIIMLL